MFLLSDPIYDNDFSPKNHWKMHTALPDPDINARPFVYIQMGAFAATQATWINVRVQFSKKYRPFGPINDNCGYIIKHYQTSLGTYLDTQLVGRQIYHRQVDIQRWVLLLDSASILSVQKSGTNLRRKYLVKNGIKYVTRYPSQFTAYNNIINHKFYLSR